MLNKKCYTTKYGTNFYNIILANNYIIFSTFINTNQKKNVWISNWNDLFEIIKSLL